MLLPDDIDFLQSLDPTWLHEDILTPLPNTSSETPSDSSSRTCSMATGSLALLCAGCSVLGGAFTLVSQRWWGHMRIDVGVDMFARTAIAPATFAVLVAPFFWWALHYGGRMLLFYQHQCNLAALESLVTQLNQAAISTARAMRFVQEIELTSRGYSVTYQRLPPISRLEIFSNERKCRVLHTLPMRYSVLIQLGTPCSPMRYSVLTQ